MKWLYALRAFSLLFSSSFGGGFLLACAVSSQAQILNVTDFGARGDAVQFCVNTVSNSVVITTSNQFSSADIGKTIELFRVGKTTINQGTNFDNQDLIGSITNIVDGTNLYVKSFPQDGATNYPPQRTATNVIAVLGTDNTPAFSNTVAAAASYTNAIIEIPNGTYLMMPVWRTYFYGSIFLRRGGLHFRGESRDGTVLLSRGAWQIKNTRDKTPSDGSVFRGFLIQVVAPITNDYPLIFENMTWDGGVQPGNATTHGFPASTVNGMGWDINHGAYLTADFKGISGTVTHQILSNLNVVHWRGEMIKSSDGNTNGNIEIQNCLFGDGNATALNVYPSWNVRNNTFSNLFQVAELYQQYQTNTGFFCNNFITNITGNGFAINGGKGDNPAFVIQDNTFYLPGNGYNGIVTTPGDNIFIISNRFIFETNGGNAIVLGAAGYQGTCHNSNIVIEANNFVEPSIMVEIAAYGATTSTNANRVQAVQVHKNTVIHQKAGSLSGLTTYGWSTNIHFFSNNFIGATASVNFGSGYCGSPYALVDIDNDYYRDVYDSTGKTNIISYAKGSKFRVIYQFRTGTVYALSDSDSNQIPKGAQIVVTNAMTPNNAYKQTFFPVYLDSALTRGPIMVTQGQAATFYWNNGLWSTNIFSSAESTTRPPYNLRLKH